MNIIQILQLIAIIVPPLCDMVDKILTAIHSTPGSPEHTAAITEHVTKAKVQI